MDCGIECTLSKFIGDTKVWCSQHGGGKGCHTEGPGQALEVDLCEPHEVQQGHVQGPAHGLGNLKHKYRLDREWIESNPEEKDFRVLIDQKSP